MKRLFILIIQVILFLPLSLQAQEAGILPDDPRIVKGKMDNGLEYYVVQNPVHKGYADFYLVEKTGTSVEAPTQEGMTALLCNLALLSTRNFPDGDLFTFIDDMGLSTQRDYGLTIGFDECIYKLSNVPLTKNPTILDSALLVMFNFSSGIDIFEETLPQGKKYAKNSFADMMTYRRRIDDEFRRQLMPNSPYAIGYPSEMLRFMDSYPAIDLRDFYSSWYRPDLQALVIVGDVRPDEVKSKIRTLFQAASKRTDIMERIYPEVELPAGPLFACAVDKEAASSEVSITLVSPSLPLDLRMTAIPLVEGFFNSMMESVMKGRLSAAKEGASFPIFSVDVSYGSFLDVRDKDGLKMTVETLPSYSSEALSFLVSEVERISRYGVSENEFKRAKDSYMKRVQYQYDWRANIPNNVYTDRCLANYLDGYPLASVEELKSYLRRTDISLNLSQLDDYMQSFFGDTVNRVVTCVTSEGNRDALINGLKESYHAARSADGLEQYVDKTRLSALDTLEDRRIVSGKIKSKTIEPISKASLWTLSNGAQVLVKNVKTEPERILFQAVARGGLSLYPGNAGALSRYVNDITAISNPADTILNRHISESLTTLSGKFPSKDMAGLIPYIYLNFKPIVPNDVEYGKYMSSKKMMDDAQKHSPEAVFAEMVGNSIITRDDPDEEIDYHTSVDFINRLFSNAADFTFIFVGDIDEKALEKLVCKYIASIPGDAKKRSAWKDGVFFSESYDKTLENTIPMEFPRYYHQQRLIFPSSFDVDNLSLSGVVSGIIKRRITKELFGTGVYVYAENQIRKHPSECMVLDFKYITSGSSSESEECYYEVLSDLMLNGANESEVQAAKAAVLNQAMVSEKVDLSFWADILTSRFIYGKDFYTKGKSAVESLSVEQVNEAIRNAITKGHRMKFTLSPAE